MERLSPGTLILGIFAILLGLVGAYAVKNAMKAEPEAVVTPQPKERAWKVPVAVMDLPAGRTIAESDFAVLSLTEKERAKAKLPPSWMENPLQLIGRTLREPVKQGRPFEPTSFYPAGIGPSIAERLQPGQRAVTIPFDASLASASLITPGASVDVLFRALADPRLKTPEVTVTLLTQIKVLAVGQSTLEGSTAGPAGTVTLAATETQARALEAVEGRGKLMLVLRNSKDPTPAGKLAPTIYSELLGLKEPEPSKPFTTQIYRRGRLSTATFQDGQLVQAQAQFGEPAYGLPVNGQSRSPFSDEAAAPSVGPEPIATPDATSGRGTEQRGLGGRAGRARPLASEKAQ